MLEDRTDLIFKYLKQNQDTQWNTYYLRTLRKNENYVLIHFESLMMDIPCYISNVGNWIFGQKLLLYVDYLNYQDNIVYFKSIV